MDKLKKASKDGKRAYFSKSEPDKLFIVLKGISCQYPYVLFITVRLKVCERQFFSSGKARLFFTFGAWVGVFRFFLPSQLSFFVPVLSWFGCLVFVISFFAVVFVYGSFGILYSMLINLYMICGSFDMDTVIYRSFVFSFRYSAQRLTPLFKMYRFHSSLFTSHHSFF